MHNLCIIINVGNKNDKQTECISNAEYYPTRQIVTKYFIAYNEFSADIFTRLLETKWALKSMAPCILS